MTNKILGTVCTKKIPLMLGPVVNSSGCVQPFYYDERDALSMPEHLEACVEEMVTYSQKYEHEYDVVCGAAVSGIILSSPLSLRINRPHIYVRLEAKRSGRNRAVEGAFVAGQRVLLVDDATGAGKNKRIFIKNLEAAGLRVTVALSVFCRNKNRLADSQWAIEKKIVHHALIDWNDLSTECVKRGIITSTAQEIMNWYAKDPYSWHKNEKKMGTFLNYKKDYESRNEKFPL